MRGLFWDRVYWCIFILGYWILALIYLGIIGISKLILRLVDKINFGILDKDTWVTFFWDIAIPFTSLIG